MKTNRRWLKSAIQAAAHEQVMLPWAAKRTAQQFTAQTPKVGNVVHLMTANIAPVKMAIAAA
jgi:hypothetical protein